MKSRYCSRYCFTFAKSWRLFKASPPSGFCQQKKLCKMASGGDFKDFGPLVGAIDQGTSSSRFLVSRNNLFYEKYYNRPYSPILQCSRNKLTSFVKSHSYDPAARQGAAVIEVFLYSIYIRTFSIL